MGKVITFAELPYREAGPGVTRAPITGAEMKEMAAEVIRLAPGAQLTESVPAGADRYLFTLTGAATVAGGGASRTLVEESFATIQEGAEFTLGNPGRSEATLISVITPPPGSPAARAGFAGGLATAARATTPVHDVPTEKKRRIYFVGTDAVRSERAHAMIVEYGRDTVTGLHMHPNAESMFVLLSGKTRFTVNGEDVVVGRGQATVFPMGDRHGLRVAEGEGVSFLEFHIPAGYTTVRG
ncbi:MAG TPA: cupin domain-containing protein [Methylomirabilota bacterium]|jgi:mannose-6-phosphate isomerase-like protein (cupin superfamily)